MSVEDRRHGLPRIDHLRETPAAVRFLSIEPLLDHLGTIDLTGIDRMIVGGESGPGARLMDERWVLSLRDPCRHAGDVRCASVTRVVTEKTKERSAKPWSLWGFARERVETGLANAPRFVVERIVTDWMGGETMNDLRRGMRVWIACNVKPGVFPDERVVQVRRESDDWVGYVPTACLRDPIAEGETAVQAIIDAIHGERVMAFLPGDAVSTGIFVGRREQVIPFGALEA